MGEEEQKERGLANDELNIEEMGSPTTVTFPKNFRTKQPQHPPLKVEVEDKGGLNPQNMWQVYALGGFLIARWLWGRWQERRARRRNEGDGADNNLDESANHRPNF